jgi:hypothetical protein
VFTPKNTNKRAAAYTIATPDYLAYARSLKASFLKYNPEVDFIICLVGNLEHIPSGFRNEGAIICLDAMADPRIEGMKSRYNPFEMSASLKPFYAKYILDTYSEYHRLIFLDCDLRIYGALPEISDAAIIITPHRIHKVCQSPSESLSEWIVLNRYGVFNTGYFELNRKEECFKFLSWWQLLTEKRGFNLPEKNLFTEQLWIDLVPAYFDDYFINKLPGYNVGFWNLIERSITKPGEQYFVNNAPLVFYHFSHYRPSTPEMMVCYKHDYFNFNRFPHLKQLYADYLDALAAAGHNKVKDLPYPFASTMPRSKPSFWRRLIGKG